MRAGFEDAKKQLILRRLMQYSLATVAIGMLLQGCTTQAVKDDRLPLRDYFIEEFNKRTSALPPYSYNDEQRLLGKTMFEQTKHADELVKQQQWALAEKEYKDILKTYESKLPANDPQMCRIISRLMTCAHAVNDSKSEEGYARRLLAIRDKWLGAASADSAQAATRVADALLGQNKSAEAMRIIEERLSMSPDPNEDKDAQTKREVILLYQKAQILRSMDKWNDALTAVTRAEKQQSGLGPELKRYPPTADDIKDLRIYFEEKLRPH